jgi:alpha-tubulin suppressor-like RCC1 family protein
MRARRTRRAVRAGALLLALLGCRDTDSPTEPSPAAAQTAATLAAALAFWQVSGGGNHTCGVTTDNLAYCWGSSSRGQLGAGTLTGPEKCMGDRVGPLPCSTRPVLVQGGHRFRQVSAGGEHTCAVSTDSLAYCWGWNLDGQLGDGTTTTRLTPVRVVRGHRFLQVDATYSHTCGVATDHKAYCWGWNAHGQLGDGTRSSRWGPVPVVGGYEFRLVTTGYGHTCGVTTTNRVYCWGLNLEGQLGDSTTVSLRTRPYRVMGTRQYRFVDAGYYHTCALTTTDRAYCWGEGRGGQLGFGKDSVSRWPRAVVGGLYFRRVTAGGFHTCGETTTNRAYCWGSNNNGELGDGTVSKRLAPVAVLGGLYFKQLSAGTHHTCGKALTAAGYCWGSDEFGQLGDGNGGFGVRSLKPVPVLGPP